MTAPYLLRAEVPAERSDCGAVGCETWRGGCRCQVETLPSPLEWPAQSDSELEASIRRQVEGDRWLGINDESEASDERE